MQRLTNAIRRFSTGRAAMAPSQVKGHIQWIKGTGEELLGSIFSPKLKQSGVAAKEAGIAEMRAAKEVGDKKVEVKIAQEGPIRLNAEGWSEGMFGKILGCEGMRDRGETKIEGARAKVK